MFTYSLNGVQASIPEQNELSLCKFFFEKLLNFHIIPHNVGLKTRKMPANGCIPMMRLNSFLFLCVQVRISKHKFSKYCDGSQRQHFVQKINNGSKRRPKQNNLCDLRCTPVNSRHAHKNKTSLIIHCS